MKLNVHEIEEVAKDLVYDEPTESLNPLLLHGSVCDFEFHQPAAVRLAYYRAGMELFFQGHIAGAVVGHCARCLEEYPFTIAKDFSVVLVPRGEDLPGGAGLAADELDLSVYDGDLVDLTPVVREQIILALPTRPLCRDACRGLCATCGTNLNVERCRCPAAGVDPRLAVLRTAKVED